jgi:flagellar motor switch protein FliM
MIEPVKEKLYSGIQGDKFELDARWIGRLKEILMTSFVEVSAEIGTTTVPFSDVMSLKEGDVLTLNTCATDDLIVKIEDVPKFKGLPGFSRGNQAIRVTKTIT